MVIKMENKTSNPSIECSVKQCANHSPSEDYCTLGKVRIATHEPDPKVCECVDCESFAQERVRLPLTLRLVKSE